MAVTQEINLNLIPDSEPVVVHVDQYDTGTGRLKIYLYNGNTAYSPSGTAKIQGTKPDGRGFEYSATLSGNLVTANLTEQMTIVAGIVRTQVVVTESSGRTGTFAFDMDVQKSALPADSDMSESAYEEVMQMMHEVEEAVESTAADAATATQKATAAANSAAAAANSASSASSSATTATQKAAAASDSATTATNKATAASNSATAAAGSATTASIKATEAAGSASAAAGYATTASNKAAAAGTSEAAAAASAASADGFAEDAEAWAKGTRDGTAVGSSDDTYHNNSKYYAERAAASESNAADSASDAAGALSQIDGIVNGTRFTVDFATGELKYTNEATYSFSINTATGNLEWEVNA